MGLLWNCAFHNLVDVVHDCVPYLQWGIKDELLMLSPRKILIIRGDYRIIRVPK